MSVIVKEMKLFRLSTRYVYYKVITVNTAILFAKEYIFCNLHDIRKPALNFLIY